MKQLLITIAAVLLVGCGESQQSATAPEPNSEPPTTEVSDISLIVAAEDGNIEAVKQNLAEGVDVNTRSYIGESPLHGAATFGHKEIVELLIAKGADLNAKGGIIDGTTPLHESASNGHWEVAEVLIAKGADVNAKQENGRTPLHTASHNGHKEVVELLISKGADLNAMHVTGGTPLNSAEKAIAYIPEFYERSEDKIEAEKKEIADLLRKHGAKTTEELKAEGN